MKKIIFLLLICISNGLHAQDIHKSDEYINALKKFYSYLFSDSLVSIEKCETIFGDVDEMEDYFRENSKKYTDYKTFNKKKQIHFF